jgi:hypothetical protein
VIFVYNGSYMVDVSIFFINGELTIDPFALREHITQSLTQPPVLVNKAKSSQVLR